jgi:uncharacterized protein YjiS (DUF1127 family)
MSQTFVLEPYPAKFGARSRLPMLSGWVQAINMWLARRQGWQDLNLLDDRMLKDVGIPREQVIRNARQPF